MMKDEDEGISYRPVSLEEREAQLIALAYDEAEKRIKEGTASAQEITHFLRMGSTREKREAKMDQMEMELKQAKRDALESYKKLEAMYTNAIEAVTSYRSPATSGTLLEEDML